MAEIKQAKFVDKTGQEKDAVFIGAERAIFDDDGKRLDQKLDEMKEATGLVATDTKGVIGAAGAEVSLQALIDGVAKKVIDELVTNATLAQTLASYMTKSLMSSTQVNDANKVPTSALAYAMQQQITQLNSDLEIRPKIVKASVSSGTVKIAHKSEPFSHLISIQGSNGRDYVAGLLNGYGPGGSDRTHYAEIIQGTKITHNITENILEISGFENWVNVTVLVLMGLDPDIFE